MASEKKKAEWKEVCDVNADCENDMLCRDYFYDLDDKLTSWDRGKICVADWILDTCGEASEFMLLNANYEEVGFDYTYSQRCISMEAFDGASTLAATVMATLFSFFILN